MLPQTLILYVFHEINDNVRFFVNNALHNNDNTTFLFIINNTNISLDDQIFPKIFSHNNTLVYIRKNIGHDFQGWNSALFLNKFLCASPLIYDDISNINNETDYLYQYYDNFIFINSTVKGPHLPCYATENWPYYFISKLNSDIKLVGISCNSISDYHPITLEYIRSIITEYYNFSPNDYLHVQSMFFCTDKVGLEILFQYKLFAHDKQFPRNKDELIFSSEIAMSSIMRHEKKTLFSFLKNQGTIPYNKDIKCGDVWWSDEQISPYETIFVKTTPKQNYH